MSLLQCTGCQQKRRIVQPSPAVLIARQHIHDGRKVNAQTDKELKKLGIDTNNLPIITKQMTVRVNYKKKLIELNKRLSRIERYISDTPENTPPYYEHQRNRECVEEQIRDIHRQLEMQ